MEDCAAYLGAAGNLVEFACPSDEQITGPDLATSELTFAGVNKAKVSRTGPRVWQVGLGTATPAQIGQLTGLLAGLYGRPPWTYVGPWAQVTNLLSPAASMLLPGSWFGDGQQGQQVLLSEGARPEVSVNTPTGAETGVSAAPATAGIPVTGSVWAVGDPTFSVHLDFRDAANKVLSTVAATHSAPVGGALVRRSVTGTPPAGTANVILRVRGAIRAALPAITWTEDLAAWAVGGGAPKVIAHGLSQAVQAAVRDAPYLRRTSAQFTLEEVGNA